MMYSVRAVKMMHYCYSKECDATGDASYYCRAQNYCVILFVRMP